MSPWELKFSHGTIIAAGMDEVLMQTMFDGNPGVNEVAAMFKIGNMKEFPTIPDHPSEEGKEFMSVCNRICTSVPLQPN